MRNLLLFIIRYHAFFIFMALEMVSIVLITRNNNYHQSFAINSSNAISGGIFNAYNNVEDYLYLKKVNENLMEENAGFRSKQPSSLTIDTVTAYCIDDSLYRQVYEYIPSKVLSITTNQFNNYLTLNRGAMHGIEKGMGVIGPDGVVGVVTNVSEHFSRVMILLHKDARVSCKIERTNTRGTLIWKSTNPFYASLAYVNQPADLAIGDVLLTDGSSTFYPEDIPVGTITGFELPEGSDFYDIDVKLSTHFPSLEYAYIVNYLFREERSLVEGQQP